MATIVPDLEMFWHNQDIENSRGYMGGNLALRCPSCGRYAKIRSVAAILGRGAREYPRWYNRCAFQVWCRKDGDSGWLIL